MLILFFILHYFFEDVPSFTFILMYVNCFDFKQKHFYKHTDTTTHIYTISIHIIYNTPKHTQHIQVNTHTLM